MTIQIQIDDPVSPALQRFTRSGLSAARKDFVRRLSQSALEQIVDGTPVRSGRASAAWGNGLNQLGGQYAARGSDPEAIAEGRSLGTVTWTSTQDATQVQATNSVDYISFLEYGTRHMAPRAIVRKALSAVRSIVGSFLVLSGPGNAPSETPSG